MGYLNILFTNFIVLLNDDALLASTNAFIPFIIIPPIAATPWIITNTGIALLFLVLSPDVSDPWCLICLARVPVKYS